MGFITGRTKIDFVEYTIGQNFLNTVSSWFESRTIAQSAKFMDWLQGKSHWIPIILKNLFLVIVALVAVEVASSHLEKHNSNQDLAVFLIMSLCGIALSVEVGYRIGQAIESAVDRIWKLAFIQLNEGDHRLLKNTEAHNRDCWISVCGRFFCALILGFVPKIITSFFAG